MRFFSHLFTFFTWVNPLLLAVLLIRDWRIRKWLFMWDLYTGPNTLSDHALSLQLGLLQATVVCVGVGLTGVGVLGFRNMQEDAKNEAVDEAIAVSVPAAKKRAEEMVRHYLAEQKAEAAKEKANPQQPASEPDKPEPSSLSDRRPQ